MNAEYIFLLLVFAEKEDVSVLTEEPPPDAPNITGFTPGGTLLIGTDLRLNCSVRGGNPPVDEVIFVCTGPQTIPDAEDVRHTDANQVTTVSSPLKIMNMNISVLKYACECHAVWNGSTIVYNATSSLNFNSLALASKSVEGDDDEDLFPFDYLALILGCILGAFLLLLVMLLAFKARNRGQAKPEEDKPKNPNDFEYIFVEPAAAGLPENTGDSSPDESGTTTTSDTTTTNDTTTVTGDTSTDFDNTTTFDDTKTFDDTEASAPETGSQSEPGTSVDYSGTGNDESSMERNLHEIEVQADLPSTEYDSDTASTTAPLTAVLIVEPAALEEASRMRHKSEASSYASDGSRRS